MKVHKDDTVKTMEAEMTTKTAIHDQYQAVKITTQNYVVDVVRLSWQARQCFVTMHLAQFPYRVLMNPFN